MVSDVMRCIYPFIIKKVKRNGPKNGGPPHTCMQSRWRLEVCRMFGGIIRGVSAGVWSQVIRGRFALYIKWTFGTFYLFY